jgi:phospholipid/cholesterol/gamma-HCH transport system permease protein
MNKTKNDENHLGYWKLLGGIFRSGLTICLRPRDLSVTETLNQMRIIGVLSLPTAGLIAVSTGFVLALVLESQLAKLGIEQLVPSMLWRIATQQVVPLGVAFIFTGRSVSAVTAELGSMQVSEEVKALFTMGIDAFPYLLLPRFLAFQVMLPVVTLICIYAAIAGGWLACACVEQMSIEDYLYYLFVKSKLEHVVIGLGKAAIFAFIAAIVSFYKGMNVRFGSRQVSQATTSSVVLTVVLTTVVNAIFTFVQIQFEPIEL